MLREFHLADVLTLANAACGLAGVFFAMEYMTSRSPVHFFAAAALSPAALLFDWLDGRLARWRHQQSVLGRELDSLADIISFGVAPAALGFAAGLRGGWGLDRADLLRLLRGEPPGPVQRDCRAPLGGTGQGGLFRRHPHTDYRAA
jgi:phosphatidylserine synthase